MLFRLFNYYLLHSNVKMGELDCVLIPGSATEPHKQVGKIKPKKMYRLETYSWNKNMSKTNKKHRGAHKKNQKGGKTRKIWEKNIRAHCGSFLLLSLWHDCVSHLNCSHLCLDVQSAFCVCICWFFCLLSDCLFTISTSCLFQKWVWEEKRSFNFCLFTIYFYMTHPLFSL